MRVERTFAFVDLCGFTAFTDAHGDEHASAVLARFRAEVRAVASDFGVRVAKWLGDGAMFVGVDGHQLVGAVLELEQRMAESGLPLPLRAGLATGGVIVFEGDDYIGGPVNLAARLCDVARPHEVLGTAAVAALVPEPALARPAGERFIAGLAAPVPVVRLGGSAWSADEPAPGPAAAAAQ
jgi:adenylate cyclase